MRKRLLGALAAVVAVAAIAVPSAAAGEAGGPYDLRLATQRLAPLAGARYEVWVIYGHRKLSAGTFTVDANSRQDRTRFVSPRDPADADAIAVTIEPVPDRKPGPSGIVVLAGKPAGGQASLAFPIDLKRLAGSFILATPTDDPAKNETAGIWFVDLSGGLGPSLELPSLGSGWVWEGWSVTQGTPLSTGRFSSAEGADRSSRFSGPKAGPAFPGEDFVRNLPVGVTTPVDLADGKSLIVVTLEPDLKGKDPTGPGPFSIKPLARKVPQAAADHASISLRRELSGVPTGRATF